MMRARRATRTRRHATSMRGDGLGRAFRGRPGKTGVLRLPCGPRRGPGEEERGGRRAGLVMRRRQRVLSKAQRKCPPPPPARGYERAEDDGGAACAWFNGLPGQVIGRRSQVIGRRSQFLRLKQCH